ncbi:unnamed protein product [Cylindrotheca closterium]|uniref:MCM C-terminal AAA(+) ATPase domain-containing protein n=1 Tax=Cylindrotheca closterium TaxID=2856 RepID=A0AAD2GDK4_9STRA|nr:unnamed protein product [Cylindrotheca closterium]
MRPNGTTIEAENAVWTAEKLQRANYKDLGSPSEVENRFLQHLLSPQNSCRAAITVLLTAQSTTTRDFSLEIDAFELLLADCVLGQMLLKYPSTLLRILENSIVRAQKVLKAEHEQQELDNDSDDDNSVENNSSRPMSVKGDQQSSGAQSTRVHARLVHLPPTITRNSVASMTAKDVGKIVQLSGTVVRTSSVQMYESARKYKCTGKDGCGQTFMQNADLEQRTNAMAKPDRCPLILDNCGQRCKGTNLQHQKDGSIHTDYQEIKIQEAASKIGIGHIPRSLMVKLQHDLVDSCQPGDEVQLVGSLIAQWHQSSQQPGIESNVGMALDAHSIRVVQENSSSAWKQSGDPSNSNTNPSAEMEKFKKEFDAFWQHPLHQSKPIAARDFICKAVCPKLYGLHIIKLGLLITLIGGVQGTETSNSHDRQQQERTTDFAQQHFEGGEQGGEQEQDREDVYLDGAPQPFQMNFNDRGSNSTSNINYGGGGGTNNQSQQQQRKKRKQETAVEIRRRDMSHILIVGDPGTGKSQILRFAAALCPRSVLTTGVGTSAAGLTCAAVRDGADKEFALEAGALVLADKGICCIDEFGCIRSEDRTTIHEAMEQQTLSVAKAGIVCKLNCRATIIAVMNPKDCIYDNHSSLSNNTGLGTPLLSRFDLIFKLVDTSDAERDSNVTTYLLNRAIQGTGLDVTNAKDGSEIEEAPWQMEKLRAYISIVKERFEPIISDDAAILLERHYEKVRSAQSSVIPVTVRFLESLIRLTQAHARLMHRNEAILQDAVAVLRVMECTAYAYGGFDGNVSDSENVMYCDPMYMDESDRQPDEDFLCFEYLILKRYDMLHHTTDERRKKAEDLLYPPDDGFAETSGVGMESWLGIEHPRERQVERSTVQHDHYGRDYIFPDKSQRTPRKRSRNQ